MQFAITDTEATYPELLADVAAQVGIVLADAGIDKEIAADAGLKAAEHLRTHWAGAPVYIPKGESYALTKRDLEIFEKFNGRNHASLAREYNLTVMRIYQIIKAVRAAQIQKRQGALF